MVNPIFNCHPSRKLKTGFGNLILGFEIYLKFDACNL